MASRVLRNKPDIEHGFDRLVAAAAILIGSRKGWSDPKDRRVVEMAERIAAVEREGLPPAKVKPEQKAEGVRLWERASGELPDSGWIAMVDVIGFIDGTLWLTGEPGTVSWMRRRYVKKVSEILDVDVQITTDRRSR